MDPAGIHEKYMRRCLELARKGLGMTASNPLVGSVIVSHNRIIGEGYHHEFGGPHAEVNAINSVIDKSLFKDSTLYVNLEPCSHFGKTPPCSLLIRQTGIPRVVIGSMDPNPRVSGRGVHILEEAGIEVVSGILPEETFWVNRRFFKYITRGEPYVILKWAESSDGFLDKNRAEGDEQKPNWITNHSARMMVHKWRSEEAGIMVGVNTVLTDNPRLNVRDWTGKNPLRIIVDRNDRIGQQFNVKDDSQPTIIFSVSGTKNTVNTEYIDPDNDFSLANILRITGEKEVSSVIVEGGALLINSFLGENLWDEARVFSGNMPFHAGVKAPVIRLEPFESIRFRNNALKFYQRADL